MHKFSLIRSRKIKAVKLCLAVFLLLNLVLWFLLRDVSARWLNVPPAPEKKIAAAAGLGDAQLAYRIFSVSLQNLDYGGRVSALNDYNYDDLTKWFFVMDDLDPRSDFIPYLAAYYFGGVQDGTKFAPALDYLEKAGSRTQGQKWRWLAQGVYLARFRVHDLERSLDMARKLAAMNVPDMPAWARQMPAFVMTAMGEKEAAYALLMTMMQTQAETLPPEEVLNIRYYICQSILSPEDAGKDPLCEGLKL